MYKHYLKYLKDNPNGYWFKRKYYGWGWGIPSTWQGWFTLVIFIAYIFCSIFVLASNPNPTQSYFTWFWIGIVLAIIILVFIGYKKGEKPKWQWGLSKEDKARYDLQGKK